MAKLSAHGSELLRYFSIKYRGLCSLRSDGYLLVRRVADDWKIAGRLPKGTDPKTVADSLKAKLAPWKLRVERLPSLADIEAWSLDCAACETTDGEELEPDYRGDREHGPSWLVALGYV